MDYMKLQNGSDVRGIAMEGIAGEHVSLSPEIAANITTSFVTWLGNYLHKKPANLTIGVGRDSRLSGPALQDAVLCRLGELGCHAMNCQMASTPAMFMSTIFDSSHFDGSIMITASHLPWNRNGLKFFTKDGGLESRDIKWILSNISENNPLEQPGGTVENWDIMKDYTRHLRDQIIREVNQGETPLKGLKIAVDAGNGAGGFYAEEVLAPLGADISASVFLNPDGHFPNHVPNPENPEAMASIRSATLKGECNLGLIFDTDVDRAGAVEADGTELGRNRLIALMSAIVAEQSPHCTIVTDSVTSAPLHDFINQKLFCTHHRFKRGYKNVINEAIRLNGEGMVTELAMETSGHGALKENYFLDDGAYLATKLVIRYAALHKDGKDFSFLLDGMREPLETKEIRFPILTDDFKASGEKVLKEMKTFAEANSDFEMAPDNYEGIRCSVPSLEGWFLLRLSLHDPLMPLNIESDVEGGADKILNMLKPFLLAQKDLNTSLIQG